MESRVIYPAFFLEENLITFLMEREDTQDH